MYNKKQFFQEKKLLSRSVLNETIMTNFNKYKNNKD